MSDDEISDGDWRASVSALVILGLLVWLLPVPSFWEVVVGGLIVGGLLVWVGLGVGEA